MSNLKLIPVSERLPPLGVKVLAWAESSSEWYGACLTKDGWLCLEAEGYIVGVDPVTHWAEVEGPK